jgi:putative drug exporter of the RND superfamily
MLTRLGWFTVRRRKWVLSLTALFVVFAGVFGTRAFGVLQEGGFDDTSSESYEAQQLLVDRFGGGEPNLVLVVSADSGNVDDAGVGAAAEQLTSELQSLDGVAQVGSYWNMGQPDSLRSNDGASALVVATVVGDEEVVAESVEEATDTLAGDRGVIDVKIGGREAVNADIGRTIEGDLFLAEMIAIPLTLLLLRCGRRNTATARGCDCGTRDLPQPVRAGQRHRRVDLRHQPHDGTRPRPRHRLQPVHRVAFP